MLLFLLVVFIFAQDKPSMIDKFAWSDTTAASKGMHLRGKKQYKFWKLGYCKAQTGGGNTVSEKYYMSGTKLYYEMWNGTTCSYPGLIWSKTFVDIGHATPIVGDRAPTRDVHTQLSARIAGVTAADLATQIGTDSYGIYFFDTKGDCDGKDYSKVSYVDIDMIDPTTLTLCTSDDGPNTNMEWYAGKTGHDGFAGFNITYSLIVDDGAEGYNYSTYVAESPHSASSCVAKNLKEGPFGLEKCSDQNPFLPLTRSVLGTNSDAATIPDGILLEIDERNLYYNALTAGTMYNASYDEGKNKWEECNILIEQSSPAYASLIRCEPNTYTGKCNWDKCDYAAGNDGPSKFIETFPVDSSVDTCLTLDDDTWIFARHNHREESDDLSKAYKLQFIEKPMKNCGGSDLHGYMTLRCNDTGVNKKGYYEVLMQRYTDDACTVKDGPEGRSWGLFCVKDLAYPWRCDVCGGLTGCTTCVSKSKCSDCMNGYYLNGDTCSTCPTGCTACDSATVCTTCLATGYFKDGDSCEACSANCDTCTGANVCTKCATGYQLENNACVEESGDSSAAVHLVISISSLLLLLFVA